MTAIEAMQIEIENLRALQVQMIDDTGTVYTWRRYEYQALERTIQTYRLSISRLKELKSQK